MRSLHVRVFSAEFRSTGVQDCHLFWHQACLPPIYGREAFKRCQPWVLGNKCYFSKSTGFPLFRPLGPLCSINKRRGFPLLPILFSPHPHGSSKCRLDKDACRIFGSILGAMRRGCSLCNLRNNRIRLSLGDTCKYFSIHTRLSTCIGVVVGRSFPW